MAVCIVLAHRKVIQTAVLPALVYGQQALHTAALQLTKYIFDIICRGHGNRSGPQKEVLPLRTKEIHPGIIGGVLLNK